MAPFIPLDNPAHKELLESIVGTVRSAFESGQSEGTLVCPHCGSYMKWIVATGLPSLYSTVTCERPDCVQVAFYLEKPTYYQYQGLSMAEEIGALGLGSR